MNTIQPLYAEMARTTISQRLRDADDERRRRQARHGSGTTRRWMHARRTRPAWS